MQRLIVVSSYPPEGSIHHPSVVGVATYTKNTVLSLVNNFTPASRPEITVLAEELPETKREYQENGITVKRVWKRKSLMSFWHIFRSLQELPSSQILLELELAMFGGIINLLPLPFLLLYLKLSNRKVTIIAHQIITSAADVHGQLNLPQKGLKTTIVTFMLQLFYRVILLFSTQIIVFDEFLKNTLSNYGSPKKIAVIPHGVEHFDSLSTSKKARQKLGLPEHGSIILYFGFLAWYKGTDLLLEMYSKLPRNNRPLLIIAGGPNPNHKDKIFYQDYIKKLQKKALDEDVTITGFVPEDLITDYFLACDVCVLPYRAFMSSSGPLSFAFATQKLFLLSDKLKPIFQTEDIAIIMKNIGISEEDLTFSTYQEFHNKVNQLLGDEELQKKVKELNKQIANARAWNVIGKKYCQVLELL